MYWIIELITIFIATLGACKYFMTMLSSTKNNTKKSTSSSSSSSSAFKCPASSITKSAKTIINTPELKYTWEDLDNRYYFPKDETQEKFDYRWKTCEIWQKCTVDQMRQLTQANLDTLYAMMRLQGLKYRMQGIGYMEKFYERFIQMAQDRLPEIYKLIDGQAPGNETVRKVNTYYLGVSFEEYRWMGQQLDVRRKNVLTPVGDTTEQALMDEFKSMQKDILTAILWANEYIMKKGDTFWGGLHVHFHELVSNIFKQINDDLDQLPSDEFKKHTLQILIEEVGVLTI
ncbi:uncharacterized protein LOC128953290 [Oppia nitens]|uniref:uncharacterized protein LOC128953290 n=1 Tax=Oppia nitens TaxID=1686743 RepID=UPI0023DB2735|nr:uncharacterized protein LOC128953290 [Oppia nitens]